ncbi:uncharacterized protein [Gossypium hirsutum]|uniref:Gag-Pol polyprotein n=1 Tax=Gossypium hirsutum TaxID=3635 RepID=A0A1U8NMB8_GOSHI|nr:uncharacterized protein LOC107949914 [Gossypium hirsutum]
MNQWFTDLMQGRTQTQQPHPPTAPPVTPPVAPPPRSTTESSKRSLIEKLRKIGACYRYGGTNHFIRNCPKLSKKEEEQKENQTVTCQKGKRSGQSSAAGTTRSGMRDYAIRSEARAPARTYAIRSKEEAAAPDVIAGIFYLFDNSVYALIDLGSTHSYVCTTLVSEKKLSVEFTDYDVQVTNPLGQNWLTKHDAVVNYRERRIDLKNQAGEKGNEAYLPYILDIRGSESKLKQLAIVNEFANVFLEEFSGLPSDREVEFVIDVIPGTAPISKTPFYVSDESDFSTLFG